MMIVITWYHWFQWNQYGFSFSKIACMFPLNPILWDLTLKKYSPIPLMPEAYLPELQTSTYSQNPLLPWSTSWRYWGFSQCKAYTHPPRPPQITHLRVFPDHRVAPQNMLHWSPSLQSSLPWSIVLYPWQPMLWLLSHKKHNINTFICSS